VSNPASPSLRALVVSHVLPFPGISGQQQRVANTLRGLRERFQVTFLTPCPRGGEEALRRALEPWCDEALLVPSLYASGGLRPLWHRAGALLFALATGLKTSNYALGRVELPPRRVEASLGDRAFDIALFEYFHAWEAAASLRSRGLPTVLDTHNVLWQAYDRQLRDRRWLPASVRRWALGRYRRAEEQAWQAFTALVAITPSEGHYIRSRVPPATRVIKACMGIDLEAWPRCWDPSKPPRVAYYGGLGSDHNVRQALRCHARILPLVWKRFPEAEFWIVGSKPPPEIQALAADRRVRVTGFVDRPQEVLKTMTACLCPWEGTYGFRSRLVEVMAVGVPVVASPDAAYGMDLRQGRGIFFEPHDARLAAATLRLLEDPSLAADQSRAARASIEDLYGFPATYGRLTSELAEIALRRDASGSGTPELRAAL
jgi:glycosyltransferase involved in cell wall biosynthesis